ncbi:MULTISPECIES: hemolysin family protein [unclassified Arthrobacter]|uniref:hemolysin family protein n=1 Tax=unclassified Arthrobacter TaxID=235627 RepID=UPI001E460D9F|nr:MULTISPECIES: hemolysin family protein [unclassified Arthrobacter]MCC9145418.1 hemolysin family protein [Arthrobacter sp. zg-Y919]MDK1276646.1 hemolysin family protein [Arthrobacter sp. zg.Y919]MDM7989285.1 hemolysin family protein [Arthrobacter sp. zg-Y877]WIB04405.1 hemolysin family protein [Arthrobacter sp. zg-Y919]
MDVSAVVNLLLVVFFILVGGIFAAAEMALVTLRESQLSGIERSGKQGRRTAHLARNPNLFLSAIQIGVTLAGFFSAAYGASALAPTVVPLLRQWGLAQPAAEATAFILLTLAVAYLSLVFSELVPKRLAMQNAVLFARVLSPGLNLFAVLMRPVIRLLSFSTDTVVRLLGGNPEARTVPVSSEELWDMVAASPMLAEDSRRILNDVFGAGTRLVQEVMRPRTEVVFVRADLRLDEALHQVRHQPYSRYPVTGASVDDIVGFIHVRDLMPDPEGPEPDRRTVADILRPILFLPGTAAVLPSLGRMRRGNSHIAVVADEYGGTDGIVTLEDLVEELVGEIYDEFDTGEDPEDRYHREKGQLVVDGALILQEFERLTGVGLPEGQYETVAGYILDQLGRVARPGDTVPAPGCRLEVLGVRRRRIGAVRVIPGAPA